jgi:hypothetical protein
MTTGNVSCWHITIFDCIAKIGRNRGVADIEHGGACLIPFNSAEATG